MIAGPTGIPHAVVIDGGRRSVTAIREDWLVQDRWWTDEPVDRHYYELVVDPGRVIIAYRDARTGGWFTHTGARGPARRRGAA